MEERFFKYAVAGLLATVIIDNQDVILKKIRSLIRWIKEKLTKRPIEVPCESEISPESDIEVTGMEALLCPISHELMRNPVITPYGHCFEKSQIETWLKNHDFCPLTRQKLTKSQLKPCYTLKYAIEQYIKIQETFKI